MANVLGRRRRPTENAWNNTIRPNPADGPATSEATTSGRRIAAYHAAPEAKTAAPANIAASHVAGRDVRRPTRVPAAEPAARPTMNDATIVANAYVVGPITSASSRVHATSYTSAMKPERAAAPQASTGLPAE